MHRCIVFRLTRKLVNASREKPVAFSTTSHGGKISSARVVQGCPASIKGSSILFNGYFPTMLDGRATVSYMDEPRRPTWTSHGVLHGRATRTLWLVHVGRRAVACPCGTPSRGSSMSDAVAHPCGTPWLVHVGHRGSSIQHCWEVAIEQNAGSPYGSRASLDHSCRRNLATMTGCREGHWFLSACIHQLSSKPKHNTSVHAFT